MIIKDGKQEMIGTFDEITEQGFNVDEILQQFNSTTEEKKTGPSNLNAAIEAEAAIVAQRKKTADREVALKFLRRASIAIANEALIKDKLENSAPETGANISDKKEVNLIVPEDKKSGGITLQDYSNFLKFASGCCGGFVLFAASVIVALL